MAYLDDWQLNWTKYYFYNINQLHFFSQTSTIRLETINQKQIFKINTLDLIMNTKRTISLISL